MFPLSRSVRAFGLMFNFEQTSFSLMTHTLKLERIFNSTNFFMKFLSGSKLLLRTLTL
jgi:hypothetical protein